MGASPCGFDPRPRHHFSLVKTAIGERTLRSPFSRFALCGRFVAILRITHPTADSTILGVVRFLRCQTAVGSTSQSHCRNRGRSTTQTLWERAAQGGAKVQYILGVIYLRGEGVPQDYLQAHMWQNLVASRRTGALREDAGEARDQAAGLMNPTRLAKA